MSSIHHAPTAEDYLQPTAALASTYRHAETPYCSCFQSSAVDAFAPSASLQLPASALHSTAAVLRPSLTNFFTVHPPPPGTVLQPIETLR
jgi:hypothetical protein